MTASGMSGGAGHGRSTCINTVMKSRSKYLGNAISSRGKADKKRTVAPEEQADAIAL